eukprot:5303600-Pyramimonas_sp.AAC.1
MGHVKHEVGPRHSSSGVMSNIQWGFLLVFSPSGPSLLVATAGRGSESWCVWTSGGVRAPGIP